MAIKLGDIARTLGHIGRKGVDGIAATGKLIHRAGEYTGLNDALGWWNKQAVDNVVARSYFSPFPMERIYDKGLGEFLKGEAEHGREYDLVPIHVETPVGGSKVNYKRLVSVAVWNTIRDEHGKKVAREVVPAVFMTDEYKGSRGNQSYSAVALIPKPSYRPASAAAYGRGTIIRSP